MVWPVKIVISSFFFSCEICFHNVNCDLLDTLLAVTKL